MVKDGRLMRIIDSDKETIMKFVLPKCVKKAVVVRCHDLLDNFSVERTFAKIRETFWLLQMRNYVRHLTELRVQLQRGPCWGKRKSSLSPIPPG
ncbi:hypothetical protein MTO96_033630 [Rhipicephalus appendiculatus]